MTITNTAFGLSPLDGRYRANINQLADIMSEFGLVERRVRVEVEYFIAVSPHFGFDISSFIVELRELHEQFSIFDYEEIKKIEDTIRHDVKAVEMWLRSKLSKIGITPERQELIHIGLTSEDVNNIAYSLQLKDALGLLFVDLNSITSNLSSQANQYADTVMLARTHGQPALPTTFGKELRVFHNRLVRQVANMDFMMSAKLNGAVGTYAAHVVANPHIDWRVFSQNFVEQFGFLHNPVTTQIEPHDSMCDMFQRIHAINRTLSGLAQDMWLYISYDMLKLKVVKEEVGSSTMPQKVNPIDFENAKGNLSVANWILAGLDHELRVSKMQRDLTDSTVLRNVGVALGHSIQGYKSLMRGLQKITPDKEFMLREVNSHPEILAEAIQTVLRAEGVINGYELLKNLTRGRKVRLADLRVLISSLDISEEAKARLMKLTPKKYIGYAVALAQ